MQTGREMHVNLVEYHVINNLRLMNIKRISIFPCCNTIRGEI